MCFSLFQTFIYFKSFKWSCCTEQNITKDPTNPVDWIAFGFYLLLSGMKMFLELCSQWTSSLHLFLFHVTVPQTQTERRLISNTQQRVKENRVFTCYEAKVTFLLTFCLCVCLPTVHSGVCESVSGYIHSVCTIFAASSRSSQARIFSGLAAIRALASSTLVPKKIKEWDT